jgi:hypothetical protein
MLFFTLNTFYFTRKDKMLNSKNINIFANKLLYRKYQHHTHRIALDLVLFSFFALYRIFLITFALLTLHKTINRFGRFGIHHTLSYPNIYFPIKIYLSIASKQNIDKYHKSFRQQEIKSIFTFDNVVYLFDHFSSMNCHY